ncbi:MAG: hypothetical protein MZW92_02715 [Comamonadaceae bacterium]|nr:hypothetical protein [Comamonadaceae bacterium]
MFRMIRTGDLADVAALNAIARRVADELHASGVDQWSASLSGRQGVHRRRAPRRALRG